MLLIEFQCILKTLIIQCVVTQNSSGMSFIHSNMLMAAFHSHTHRQIRSLNTCRVSMALQVDSQLANNVCHESNFTTQIEHTDQTVVANLRNSECHEMYYSPVFLQYTHK
jgi:hypothetical protein